MITAIVVGIVFVFLFGIVAGKAKKTNQLKPKRQADGGELDYEFINRVDQEIFGVGVEITGLPGCWWKVQRGCSQTINGGKKTHDPDGFSIWLFDADSNELGTAGVAKWRPLTPSELITQRQKSYVSPLKMVSQTLEEMDAAIQAQMKKLVDVEVTKRNNEAKYVEILSKYNGKKVDEL